ncbi:hypothetical protein Trydic_g21064 [Trypoxylus dichotomus]
MSWKIILDDTVNRWCPQLPVPPLEFCNLLFLVLILRIPRPPRIEIFNDINAESNTKRAPGCGKVPKANSSYADKVTDTSNYSVCFVITVRRIVSSRVEILPRRLIAGLGFCSCLLG